MSVTSKIFLALVFVAVTATGAYKYREFVLDKDYTLLITVGCDPSREQCFEMDCEEGVDGCDTTPYKKASVLASVAPQCALQGYCENFECSSDGNCEVTYCSSDTVEEGERCSVNSEQ
jgi:hypothetical protein